MRSSRGLSPSASTTSHDSSAWLHGMDERGSSLRASSSSLFLPSFPFKEVSHAFPCCKSAASASCESDIKLVWPLCISGSESCDLQVQVGVLTENAETLLSGQRTQVSGYGSRAGSIACSNANEGDHGHESILVMACSTMDLIGKVPVRAGRATYCNLHISRSTLSLSGTSYLPNSNGGAPIRALSLFRTCWAGGSCQTGPAVNLLCASNEVAHELQELFIRIAISLLELKNNSSLTHLQMRDVHGFTYLPGRGSNSIDKTPDRHPASPHQSSHLSGPSPCLFGSAKSGLRSAIINGLSELAGVSASVESKELDDAYQPHLTACELDTCIQAWAQHFQPLIREISYLLTCVPRAFAGMDACMFSSNTCSHASITTV